MKKSFNSKLLLEQGIYSHRIAESTSFEDHLVLFKKIVPDLETLKVKSDDKDSGLILLCLLSNSYMSFRDMILYNRYNLTMKMFMMLFILRRR